MASLHSGFGSEDSDSDLSSSWIELGFPASPSPPPHSHTISMDEEDVEDNGSAFDDAVAKATVASVEGVIKLF